MKTKIAISIDKPLLKLIDSKVDREIMRSRSQAIEYFLKRGLQGQSITAAALLIKGDHQHNLFKSIKGKKLIQHHIDFFSGYGITSLLIVTQHSKDINKLLQEIENAKIEVEIIEDDARGTAQAVLAIKNKVNNHFIVMSGDTYNNFDLSKIIKKHLDIDTMATIGLMTRENTKQYGTAILDGDYIVDFQEKPRHSATTIVNAGIYVFKAGIFEMLPSVNNLERDLFPKLARMKQLAGFFTYGEYEHLG